MERPRSIVLRSVYVGSEFCEQLARCHVEFMIASKNREESELSDRAVESMIRETLGRREKHKSPQDILPEAFVAAHG